MSFEDFNSLNQDRAGKELAKCCGSQAWIKKMIRRLPFASRNEVLVSAAQIWDTLAEADWKEAFEHHPQIGDLSELEKKFGSTSQLAKDEQKSIGEASEKTLLALQKKNEEYVKKFGYIFIVCATGKTADEMLALLYERIDNSPSEELKVAANEQSKIMQLRLEKIL